MANFVEKKEMPFFLSPAMEHKGVGWGNRYFYIFFLALTDNVILINCSQLFGEADADEEVSPDTEDPEAVGTAGEKAAQNEEKEGVVGGIERASTRTWAEEIQYDPVRLFNKVSIEYNVAKCNLG